MDYQIRCTNTMLANYYRAYRNGIPDEVRRSRAERIANCPVDLQTYFQKHGNLGRGIYQNPITVDQRTTEFLEHRLATLPRTFLGGRTKL